LDEKKQRERIRKMPMRKLLASIKKDLRREIQAAARKAKKH